APLTSLALLLTEMLHFFFSSRRRHTRSKRDWSSDVCSSDLPSAYFLRLIKRRMLEVIIGHIRKVSYVKIIEVYFIQRFRRQLNRHNLSVFSFAILRRHLEHKHYRSRAVIFSVLKCLEYVACVNPHSTLYHIRRQV